MPALWPDSSRPSSSTVGVVSSYTASDVLECVERRISGVAATTVAIDQAIGVSEAVMWLCVLDEKFGAKNVLASGDQTVLNGLRHARNKGLHEAVHVSSPSDQYSDHYTSMYSAPSWAKNLPPAMENQKNRDEERDYRQVLEGRLVLDTLRPLVDALHHAGL
jgi:hypothetical protein